MDVALANRVVEVIADAGEGAVPRYRYGSGCIVAGRTVLTAAHVVAGAVMVQVRTVRKRLCQASIDAIFIGQVTGQEPDLALVEIDDPALDLPALRLARLDRETAVEAAINCHALGFPWFAERPAPDAVREIADAVGEIPVLSKLATGLASVLVRDSPCPLPPEDRTLADSAWSGMSGGPVIAGGRLLGVVIEHAPREGQSSITMAPLSLLEPHHDHPMWGPGVRDPGAWWRRLGVTGLAELVRLPATTPDPAVASDVELSSDVIGKYRAALTAAGVIPPARWTAATLSEIAIEPGVSRARELVAALRWAIQAKPVLTDLGVGQLGLAQLQVIYRREVGAWPSDGSADILLVQAAEVEESERRAGATGVLGALVRFVVGVATAQSIPPNEHPGLTAWISSLGYQAADAQWRYQDQLGARSWLLLDLGAEPRPGTALAGPRSLPWPARITWTHVVRHGATVTKLTGEKRSVPTKDGLAEALTEIIEALPPTHQMLVDLALPAALLDAGIEHWPLFPESLSDRHLARLRWSQRLHDLYLRGRCVERAARSSWTVLPKLLTDAVLADEPRLHRWIRDDAEHAWLIGQRPAAARSDPLRALLKAGYGFVVWFPDTAHPRTRTTITKAVARIPVAARRVVIPDELPGCSERQMVIWDDPRGRGDEFTLPSPIAAEPMAMRQI
ncbi:serine protease [Micromonospora zamorensis]|uniref:trypsin-like peptidase domain-containing protein n=1 Tax=Micromonospora zamorensis TaxID=709883 RepID=UPI00386741E9|nr:serine protease [Micromonospora zamorensis]